MAIMSSAVTWYIIIHKGSIFLKLFTVRTVTNLVSVPLMANKSLEEILLAMVKE